MRRARSSTAWESRSAPTSPTSLPKGPSVILASQSPRRQQLLAEAGFAFRAVPSSFDESGVAASDPQVLASTLAREKARAVSPAAARDELVIGSDTIVVAGTTVLGKPTDAADARAMLRLLSGATHAVVTAVSIQRNGVEVRAFTETAQVTFWELGDDEIDAYIASGEPLDKAGAYGIQGHGALLIKGIEGDYYSVMGLPVAPLYTILRDIHAV